MAAQQLRPDRPKRQRDHFTVHHHEYVTNKVFYIQNYYLVVNLSFKYTEAVFHLLIQRQHSSVLTQFITSAACFQRSSVDFSATLASQAKRAKRCDRDEQEAFRFNVKAVREGTSRVCLMEQFEEEKQGAGEHRLKNASARGVTLLAS